MSEPNLVLGAVDSLALALADHGHSWTDGERAIYELAIDKLTRKPTHTCGGGCHDLGVRLNLKGEIERCDFCQKYQSDLDAWLSAKPKS